MRYRYQPNDRVEVFTRATAGTVPAQWYPGIVRKITVTDLTIRIEVEADTFVHEVVVLTTSDQLDQFRIRPIIQQAMCTCHNPPRPIQRKNDHEEWGHTDEPDGEPTFADTFHVHTDSYSRDCDGPMERSTTYQIASIVDCETKDDLWRKLCRLELAPHGVQKVEIDGENFTAEFNRATDEGCHNMSLRGCSDPACAFDGSTQRDHYAEAMGY